MEPTQQPDQTPTPDTNPSTTPTAPEETPTTPSVDTPSEAEVAEPVTTDAPQPVAPAPADPAAPAAAPSAEDPGKTLGIVGLILSILGFGLISLVISIIARNQSKKAGYSNGMALAGIIISAVTMVLGLLFFVLTFAVALS